MKRTLNRREAKFISPAFKYHQEIKMNPDGTGHWDGDNLFPVSVGPLALKLMNNGILEKAMYSIRVKREAYLHFKCPDCYDGKSYEEDEDSEWQEIGDCKTCGGLACITDPDRIAHQN